MRKRLVNQLLIIVLLICAGRVGHAQISTTHINDIDSLLATQPKPILVLLSTDWCQYCAIQKNQIRKNDNFRAKSEQFYFVEFNAEQKAPITFAGKTYIYKPKGVNTGSHELAFVLNGNPNITYPTWVLLDQKYQTLFRHNGLLNPAQLNELLQAVENTFKNK
ncbi:MAG: thioredoxin family protein [Sphingobacterium composti]|uniref:thioredoxin family protein n=1 Tax=Sphingobacterium composti TaxID=363260 RepID=UPI0013599296|nr:thioredoxin family protein [Sphingobacterium composti Ten et al. 2007 non Yoo et al. 2007]